MHPNATILLLTTALLGIMPVSALGEFSNSQASQSAQSDVDELVASPTNEGSSPAKSTEKTTDTKKPKVELTPESSYTVTNTGLKGTQDRQNRPNPLFSPTVAQINLTKGNWDDWPWKASGITGDWLGLRNELQNNGVFIDGLYSIFLNDNFSGGLETGGFSGGILSTSITIDTETLFGHPDGLFFINYQHWDWYSNFYDIADSFVPIPNYTGVNGNLPENASMNQISQLYYSQHLFDNLLNVAFGKQDAANIFSNIPGTGGFMYSGAGYSATLNEYMPSWPIEATALTAIVKFNEDICASFGWFDGSMAGLNVERSPLGNLVYTPAPNPAGRGPATFFDNDGHWFLISEWGANWQIGELELPGAICAGGWLQTGRTQTSGTLNTGPGVQDVPGAYLSLSQTLWAPDKRNASLGGGVIAFSQFGWSDPNKNAVHWTLMGGVSATGVIPSRPMDALGIMGCFTGFSDNPGLWQSTTQTGGVGPSGGYETAVEFFYRMQLTPWLAVQPGIEWLGTPGGGDPSQIEDSVMGYLMVEIIF